MKIYGVIIVIIGIKNLGGAPAEVHAGMGRCGSFSLWPADPRHVRVGRARCWSSTRCRSCAIEQQFRITLSAVWTVLNLIYAGIAFQQGHFTGDVVQIIVFCVPLAVLATFLGSKLQKKISQERFLKLTYVLLLCVASSCWLRRSVRRRAEVLLGVQ